MMSRHERVCSSDQASGQRLAPPMRLQPPSEFGATSCGYTQLPIVGDRARHRHYAEHLVIAIDRRAVQLQGSGKVVRRGVSAG